MLSQALEERHNTAQGVNRVYVIHPHLSAHARACEYYNFSFSFATFATKRHKYFVFKWLRGCKRVAEGVAEVATGRYFNYKISVY